MSAMNFAEARPKRRPSLTPMIDVVFLLLVFFMLASRFGMDMQMPLTTAGGGESAYSGPPRLVDIDVEGLRLNGVETAPEALVAALGELMESPEDTVILRAGEEAPLERLVMVMSLLQDAELTNLVLVE